MRIAYLINQYPSVSHSFIRREILALERLGHEIIRISIRGWAEQQYGQDSVEHSKTRYVLRGGPLPLLWAFLSTLFAQPRRMLNALALMWRMARKAERPLPIHFIYLCEACVVLAWTRAAKVDHLHAHFGTNSAEVAMLTHELGGPRWSFTAHGPEEFDKPHLIALTEKILRATFVVAVSSFGRSQLFRYTPQKHWNKIRIVHCGIEPSFYQGSGVLSEDNRRLVCVGRLCEQKGQLLLIEAVHRLISTGTIVELVLAGDGEMRGEVEALISRLGLEEAVRITGWISSEQVREEILRARALILPSFAEGLPVVLMEAMALRRPVISTFVAGIPELVQSGQNGWLVPAGDPQALADAMKACLETPLAQIRAMGEAARNQVEARHDIDREAAKLAALVAESSVEKAPLFQRSP